MLLPDAICLVTECASLLVERSQMTFWQMTLLLLEASESNLGMQCNASCLVACFTHTAWPQTHRRLISIAIAAVQGFCRSLTWR